MSKGIKIRKDSWYIIDARKVILPKVLDERFLSIKAANKYIERRLASDYKHFLPIKGRNLKEFRIEYAKIKRKFYSKYCIPNKRILSPQGKKTFRTTIRRKLFGYVRSYPFSHSCDACKVSRPWDPTFATLRPYLFNGRIRRLCDKCHTKHAKP